MDWQFEIKEVKNDIKIAIIIPNIDDNIEMIVNDMFKLGYYESFRNDLTTNRLPYILIRFEPKYLNDITNKVRNGGIIYHLSPKYNLESIKEKGFIPQCKNKVYKFPPRIYFFKSEISEEQIKKLGKTLSHYNDDIRNNGEYILFTLDTDRIPKNVKFMEDCNYNLGICTEDEIPFKSVITMKEYQF